MKDTIKKFENLSFEYGSTDCCQFVGACVESVHGYNPVKWFDYETESDAADLISSYGGLNKLVTAKLGEPVSSHRDGDIALFDQVNGTQILGIVIGDDVILKSYRGVVRWPVNRAQAVWRT